MAVGDEKLVYPSASDMTITLASLAPSSTLLAGREGTAIDNMTNLYPYYHVSGKVKTNATITAGGRIEVWAIGSWDGTTWPNAGVFDGTDSDETITNANIKNSICRLVASMPVDATGTYEFGPVEIGSLFGGLVPPKWTLFVTHNTHASNALDSTGSNHQIRIQPAYRNVAAA